jgi:hypothetical protein
MALLVGQKLILISIDGITSQHWTTASNRVLSPFFPADPLGLCPPPVAQPTRARFECGSSSICASPKAALRSSSVGRVLDQARVNHGLVINGMLMVYEWEIKGI